MTNKILNFCVLILTVTLISCSSSMENKKNELTALLDSTGKMYVPDQRLAIWDYEVTDTSGVLELKLESDQKQAIEFLEKQISDDYPKVKYTFNLLPDSALHEKTYGLINISSGNMRKSPKHSSELVSQELLGTPVRVLKKKDGWYLIQSPNGYVGWIDSPGLSLRTADEMKKMEADFHIIYKKQYGHIYKNPQKTEFVSDVVLGNILKVSENKNNMYAVSLPDGRAGYVDKDGFDDIKSICFKSKVDTSQMIAFAKTFLGTSYLWGGKSSKAIDCSGYSAMIYFFNGLILQRDASQQIKYGETIVPDEKFSNLKTGDLLFFGRKAKGNKPEKVTHVGMYIGHDEFIHSSGLVRISSLNAAKENFDSSYVKMFLGARRLLNSVGNKGIERIEDNQYYEYFFKK